MCVFVCVDLRRCARVVIVYSAFCDAWLCVFLSANRSEVLIVQWRTLTLVLLVNLASGALLGCCLGDQKRRGGSENATITSTRKHDFK